MIDAFGECEVDDRTCELRRGGERQPLEPKAYDLLLHLLPDRPSVVVLPFHDLSGDGSRRHLVDGFTEDLTWTRPTNRRAAPLRCG